MQAADNNGYIASDPARSVWVSANAGTGKTRVLTNRVLRLLLAGTHPSRIVCITYTKAGAAEMQNRIQKELSSWAVMPQAELEKKLLDLTGVARLADKQVQRARALFAQVLEAPEGIVIQTIHGFCQSLLKRFPLEAGVQPHFTVIDERTASELLTEARIRLFTHEPPEGGERLKQSLAMLAGNVSETSFTALLKKLVSDRRKILPLIETPEAHAQLIDRIYNALGLKAGASMQTVIAKYFTYSQAELAALTRAAKALINGKNDGDRKTGEAIARWLALASEQRVNLYPDYVNCFLTGTLTPRKKLCVNATAEAFPAALETLLAEQSRMVQFYEEKCAVTVATMTGCMAEVAHALFGHYRRLKSARAYLDFDDLVLSVLKLLARPGIAPWVLYKLDGGIEHLLIDEAQDTSPEQWRVLAALAGEFFTGESANSRTRTVFVVGDEKQSIFSFQGAEPRAFDGMQSWFRKRIADAGGQYNSVPLNVSFRSTGPILQTVDAVFAPDAVKRGVILTQKDVLHEVHRKSDPGLVELWEPVARPEEEEVDAWQAPGQRMAAPRPETILARRIAGTIAAWLKQQRMLAAKGRPVRPGDIMILLRNRGRLARPLIKALKRHGVPVAGADRLVLNNHIAVKDMISLAEFLLLPQDDLSLAEVLRSPLIGISEEQLYTLAYDRGMATLWQRLAQNQDNLAFVEAHGLLARLLARVDYLPPFELFSYVLEVEKGRTRMLARLGDEASDALDELLSQALLFGRSHAPSMQGFLHWLQSGEPEVKRDMEQGRDEVRILTVHGSKGLEAPVVFLPDTMDASRTRGGDLLWDEKDGNKAFFWAPSVKDYDTVCRNLQEENKRKENEEYRRLLYVALTRPQDELYIMGCEPARKKKEAAGDEDAPDDALGQSWYDLIRQAFLPLASEGESHSGKDSWKTWRFESAQGTAQAKAVTGIVEALPAIALPGFLLKEVPAEPAPPQPLTPSRVLDDSARLISPRDTRAMQRGRLIHRMLQTLPDVAGSERSRNMQAYLAKQAMDFTQEERARIMDEVLAIMEDKRFAAFFGPDSVAEVPISGIVEDAQGKAFVVNAQVDRLAITNSGIWIIDYKTNQQPPEHERDIPMAYMLQMQSYRSLLRRIYSDRPVHCALLWTAAPRLMVLDENLLENNAFAA